MMAPVSKNSLAIPLLLAIAAPLAVILGIERLRSVWWTFAMYQVSICLVAPAIESRLRGRSWRQHAALLGLTDASDDRRRSHHGWTPAIILGLVTALVTGGFLVLTGDRFLDPDRLESTVAGWGVPPEQVLMMLVVMTMLNAAAEELFWRGYFPGRVTETRPGLRPPIALTVILPALLYASYHAATIGHLVADTSGVVIMTGGVLAAGLFWGWLRQRTRSVWPPLLSHGGGVLAYLTVHLWLTSVGAS